MTKEALPIFKRLGDQYAQAWTLRKIANIYIQQGKTPEGLETLGKQALPLFEQSGLDSLAEEIQKEIVEHLKPQNP